MAAGRDRRLLIPLAGALVIGADQLSKQWAVHDLDPYVPRHVVGPTYWELSYNTGAAFSVGAGVTPIVVVCVVALVVWLLAASRRARRTTGPIAVGLGLLLGGALSNLGDRLFRHTPHYPNSVVDFIRAVGWWPVFNVADACIVAGVAMLLLFYSASPSSPSAG